MDNVEKYEMANPETLATLDSQTRQNHNIAQKK